MYKKSVLIFLIIFEICVFVSIFVLRSYANSNQIGFLIDTAMLEAIARRKLFLTIREISVIFTIFGGCGIGFYAFGVIKKIKDPWSFKSKGPLCAFFLFMGTSIAFSIPYIIQIPTRMNEKPRIDFQILVGVDHQHYSRTANDYYLIFDKNTRLKVSRNRYDLAPIGRLHYTVYQGNLMIEALCADQFDLKY